MGSATAPVFMDEHKEHNVQEIPITDLMTASVELVAPDTCLKRVVKKMRDNGHSCVIVGEAGVPTGIVTERDLVKMLDRMMADASMPEHRVDEIMAREPHTVHIGQSLFDALAITRAERIRHLPVVDNEDKLVGLLTQTDLANAHFHVIEKQREIIERAIEQQTGELKEANEQLHAMSMEDALLGIGNRRAMEVDLEHTHAVMQRYNHPYTLALIDIDHFKLFNDHYGHLEGDACLQKVSQLLEKTIRKSDRLYRYGGEEFLLLLPDTPQGGATVLANRLVENLYAAAIPHCKSSYGVVTISIGIASCPAISCETGTWKQVVEQADKSLYLAKSSGRNQVA